jgi:hypothetical protein
VAIYLDNNVGLKIATVDLSEYVTSITLTQTFDEVETTAMGATSHQFSKGLEASTLTVDFLMTGQLQKSRQPCKPHTAQALLQ